MSEPEYADLDLAAALEDWRGEIPGHDTAVLVAALNAWLAIKTGPRPHPFQP